MRLTKVQKEVLLDVTLSDKREGNLLNLMGFRVYIENDCNLQLLERSWNLLLYNYDSLRIKVVGNKQIINQYEQTKLPVVNVNGFYGLEKLQKELMSEPIYHDRGQLWDAKLIDCGNSSGGMIVRMHHLCSDGYTMELLASQLEKCYLALLKGETPEINAESYTDVIDKEQDYLKSEQLREDKKWWKLEYSFQKKYSIPAGYTHGKPDVENISVEIAGDRYEKLKQFCKEQGCSMPSYLMSIAALTVYRITSKENFAIYCLINGRETWKEKKTAGCMVRTIPVFFNVYKAETYSEMIKRQAGTYLDSLRHGKMPFSEHIRLSYTKSVKCGFNFYHNWLLFSFMKIGRMEQTSKIGFKVMENPGISNLMYCAVYDIPEDQKLDIRLYYRKQIFRADLMNEIADTYKKLLCNSLDYPDNIICS